MERAAEILLPLSMDVKVIRIPGGKDPDELYASGGREAVAAALGNAQPLISVLTAGLPEKFDLATPVGRGNAAAWVANYLKLVENQVELESYVTEAASMLKVSVDAIYAELAALRRIGKRPLVGNNDDTTPKPSVTSAARMVYPAALLTLLELAVNSQDASRQIAELLDPAELDSKDPVTTALNIVINASLNGEYEEGISQITASLTENPVPEISKILIEHAECPDIPRAVSDSVADFKRLRNRDRKKDLKTLLSKAQTPEEKMKLLKEIASLS